VVTPEGLPLAYEVWAGIPPTAPAARLSRPHRAPYASAAHLGDGPWAFDEAVLDEMRQADPPICYMVGTPRGG